MARDEDLVSPSATQTQILPLIPTPIEDTLRVTRQDVNRDRREQLYNQRLTGSFGEVQMPLECITTLHGFMIDLDPSLYRPDNPFFPPDKNPKSFLKKITPVLNRHPLGRFAEARQSGTGLHVIVWLEPAVELATAAERARWNTIVRTVQCTLPADHHAPGITAVTRAVHSINSKNNAVVEVLRPGQPVAAQTVEQFVTRVQQAPFKEVAIALFGSPRVRPCPICQREGSQLDVCDQFGTCYGSCGKVTLGKVLNSIYAPQPLAANKKSPSNKERKQIAAPDLPSRTGKVRSSPKKRKNAGSRDATLATAETEATD
jgi:hypothetical protein